MPDSIRVCATSSAITSAIVETRKRSWRPAMYVAAIHAANAIAAWPEGSPPRSGVPRPDHALTAMTTITVTASAPIVSSAGASRTCSSTRDERLAMRFEKTR